MGKLKIDSKPLEIKYFYKDDTIAGHLERYLIAHNKDQGFGKMPTIDTFDVPNDPGQRAYRTYCILQISEDKLSLIQAKERIIKRLMMREEMEITSKTSINWNSFSKSQKEYTIKFNDDNRPEMKKYEGFDIPAYFVYDLEFDPMAYHHEWDHIVLRQKIRFEADWPIADKGKKSATFEDGF